MALHLKSGGIDFNEFSDQTESSELMDDYEEGTWTVAFQPDSGSMTINTGNDQGVYTKIGRLVTVQGQFTVASESGAGGTFWMTLPYTNTALTENADYTIGSVKMSDFDWDDSSDRHHVYIETYGGQSKARGGISGDNVGTGQWSVSAGSGTYAIWLGFISE